MYDCKTCKHAKILHELEKDSRFANAYKPIGLVRCAGPRYKGRTYICKDTRKACEDYEKRERNMEAVSS